MVITKGGNDSNKRIQETKMSWKEKGDYQHQTKIEFTQIRIS